MPNPLTVPGSWTGMVTWLLGAPVALVGRVTATALGLGVGVKIGVGVGVGV